ncbi:lipid biosynthesis B12-binding/radical SAM protein [Planctomycetota bacterium]
MSRVLLISTNTCVSPYSVYPLGMATVAGQLIQAGHTVQQFDWQVAGQSADALLTILRASDPEVVAVSIRNMDQVDSLAQFEETWELDDARTVIAEVREHTDVPVVIGGPAVSVMAEPIRDYVGADVAVIGEGEQALLAVVTAATAGQSLPPLWPVAKTMLCGAEQAAPAYEAELVTFYREAGGLIGVQTKRGCPYHCCYCTYPVLEGSQYRAREAEAVVADMERLWQDHGVDTVFFTDSVFNDVQGHYLRVAEALAKRALPVRWGAYLSPRGLSAEGVDLCRRGGLFAAELGTDATSDTTLKGMGKPFRWDEVHRCHDLLVQARVACGHFVIFGGPGETVDTLQEGLDNIAALTSGVVFGFSGIRVYPGTPLQKQAIAEGVIAATDDLFKPVYYTAPDLDKEWMDRTVTDAWAGRMDRVFPPQDGQRIVAMLRAQGMKGLLWDRLIAFDA